MNILIIGGTQFVGRALTEAALANGHQVTLFNRGKTNPDAFPEVERITGDRDGGLSALGERTWDVAVDTCGYVPRVVKASADYLADKVQRYVFISTISVYKDTGEANRDEDAALATFADVDGHDETTEEINGLTYGPLKVLCEQAAEAALPGRVLTVRPGLIVGPHDPTNRFTYWPIRIRRGGEVLAPGQPDYPTQFIDVRDLGEWTLHMIEQSATGIYNATGPDKRLTLGEVMQACKAVSGSDARLTWVDDALLAEHEVRPFMEMPLYVPGDAVEAFMTINVQKAIGAGLRFRSLEQTVRDTLAWVDTLAGDPPGAGGLTPEREAEVLAAHRHAAQS